MTNKMLERRLAWLILDRQTFTADDLTDSGRITLDPTHAQSAGQSGFGGVFSSASRRGLIQKTGAVVKSKAPHRKGGTDHLWAPTVKGRRWARGVLAEESVP